MKEQQEHTPTPYHRNIKPATKYTTIWAGRNEHIAYMATQGRDPEQVEKDMDFIIRACNAHYDLVAALDAAQTGLRWYQEHHPEHASPADDEMHEQIDAALDKAKAVQ